MNFENEKWLDSPVFGWKYKVSNTGQIVDDAGKAVHIFYDRNGYNKVKLTCDGNVKICSLHRLVALAFIPNPLQLREVNHIDGNKSNNAVSNLEWCTRSENVLHAFRTGLKRNKTGSDNSHAKSFYQFNAKTGKLIRKWGSLIECAKYLSEYEFPQYSHITIRSNITGCLISKNKTCCGYVFSFNDTIDPKQYKWDRGQKAIFGESIKDKNDKIYFDSVRDASESGFDPSLICKCINGKRLSHKGYKWYYQNIWDYAP